MPTGRRPGPRRGGWRGRSPPASTASCRRRIRLGGSPRGPDCRRVVIRHRGASAIPAGAVGDEAPEVRQPGRPSADLALEPTTEGAPTAIRREEGPDRLGELRLAEVPDDPGALDEADLAVL